MVSNWKVPGDTAIPCGRYRVIMNFSKQFSQNTPLLLNVPGFRDVRISPVVPEFGGDVGWIQIGTERFGVGISGGRAAFSELCQDISDGLNFGDQVWITVN